MKSRVRVLLILIFALSTILVQNVLGQETNAKKIGQTRSMSIQESIPLDSIQTSPLLNFMQYVGFKKSIAKYKVVGSEAIKMLHEKGKPENIWWKSWFCVYQTAFLAVKSQKNAIQLLYPIFILIFILVFLLPTIKTFFYKPYVVNAVKPSNAEFYKNLKKSNESETDTETEIETETKTEDEDEVEADSENDEDAINEDSKN